MVISNVYKGGRCWNANHKDAGIIVHIIESDEPNGFWGGKSLCGAEPGRGGYGWAKTEKNPTCAKCIKKTLSIQKNVCVDKFTK